MKTIKLKGTKKQFTKLHNTLFYDFGLKIYTEKFTNSYKIEIRGFRKQKEKFVKAMFIDIEFEILTKTTPVKSNTPVLLQDLFLQSNNLELKLNNQA